MLGVYVRGAMLGVYVRGAMLGMYTTRVYVGYVHHPGICRVYTPGYTMVHTRAGSPRWSVVHPAAVCQEEALGSTL